MRKNRISESLGNINQKYVDEATTYTGETKAARRHIFMKWGAVAACLCLIATAVVARPLILKDNMGNADTSEVSTGIDNNVPSVKEHGTIIADFISGGMDDAIYPVPDPGQYFCCIEVNEARREYAGKDVSFLLGFNVHNGSGEPMSIEDLSEEYQRLSDLGYRLYYVEDHWTYYGNNQKEYIPVVVGLFTDEELSNFKASEQYGYVFDFVVNGDSSPISVDEENVVTNWNYDLY